MKTREVFKLAFLVVVSVVISSSLITSCDDFEKSTYRTLASAKETYNAAMGGAADLRKRGEISDRDWQKVIEVARISYAAYMTAVDAFEAYKLTESAAEKDRVATAIAEMSRALANLLERIKPFVERKGK